MSKKNQSVVDWLWNKLKSNAYTIDELYESAKEMHKKEIVKASAQGYLMGVEEGFPLETAHNYAHQWYNNQFGEDKDE